ncbi:MAG: hypothetical protein AAF363_20695 [Bacteroidota bacterium]
MITIHTPTNELSKSIAFYSDLNYELVSASNPCLFKDANTFIEINPDRYARAGLKMYKNSWASEIQKVEALTKVYKVANGYMLNELNGCWIYLIENVFDFPTNQSNSSPAIPGVFVGLSLECTDMELSVPIWEILDFETVQGDFSSGYMTLASAEGFRVSLMKPLTCPHLFFNPSMTFFNGKDNLKVIEEIRKADVKITEEITHFNTEGIVDNIIIRDPGGYGFFIFND